MAFTEKSTLRELSESPEAKAVLEKYLPGFWAAPGLRTGMRMSLKTISMAPQAKVLKEKLPSILEELAKIE